MLGKCPHHGKSEDGYNISGVNWYWCGVCLKYTKDHNTRMHGRAFAKYNSKPTNAAAKTVSKKAQPLPARANVASAPADSLTPYIEEIDETIHPVQDQVFDYDTEE